MVDTKRLKDALSECLSVNCRWGDVLNLLDQEASLIEEKYPTKPTGSEFISTSIDWVQGKALHFLDQIGAGGQPEKQALAFFERMKKGGVSIGRAVDVALNQKRSAEYNKIYSLLPISSDNQLNPFGDSSRDPVFISLKAWLDYRFMAAQSALPRTIDWKGHRVEVHTVQSDNGPREITLVNVDMMGLSPQNWQMSAYLYVADRESSVDDPAARYNCFSLALHTNGHGPVPLDDKGCVAREKIIVTSLAGGEPHDVKYCKYDPQYWSMQHLDNSCNASPKATRLCNDPTAHITRDGYRFVDVRYEEIMRGDRLIYLSEFPFDYLLKEVLPDKEKRRTYLQHRLPELPFMNIGHAAIVLEVKDSDILVIEKLDMGPAVVSSAFDNFVEYGQHFAVLRKLQNEEDKEITGLDYLRNPHFNRAGRSDTCTQKYPNETDALPRDCQTDQFIKRREERNRWAEIRRKNCERNVAKCPDFMMR